MTTRLLRLAGPATFACCLVACDNNNRFVPAITNPPTPVLPPGVAGVDLSARRFRGMIDVTIESDVAILPRFGPATVPLLAVVSDNTAGGGSELSMFFTPEMPGELPPTLTSDISVVDGELTLNWAFDVACDLPIEVSLMGTINPSDTINFAAESFSDTCKGMSVTVSWDAFSLVEVTP